jgi:LCP family protein required for cell wall assembly
MEENKNIPENEKKKVVFSQNPIKPVEERPGREVKIDEGEKKSIMSQETIPSGDDKTAEKPKKKRRWWLWIITVVAISILAYFGYSAFAAAKRIITNNSGDGSPFLRFMNVEPQRLKGEGDGRINILLLGIGGPGHDGADLTDTMMVVSVDPVNKTVAMLSIPRDLWVDVPGSGSESRINAVHAYGEQNKKKYGDGPTLSKEVVSQILDLPIHYYCRMDFEGFKKLVDEVGGIDVNVEKDIVDPYYPDDRPGRNGEITYKVKAGMQHMDGSAALKYARSRYTTSDFDRAKRQQVIIKALKEKALSAGVMANPAKLSGIINIVGDHFRTDMQLWEMQRFLELMKDVNTNEIAHRVLDNSAEGLLKDGEMNGAYVLLPRSGNYKEIQALAHSIFTEPYIIKENARIQIQYAAKKSAQAKGLSDKLKEFGYNVASVVAASTGDYPESMIIDYTKGQKPYTLELLKNRIQSAKVRTDNNPPSDIDIVIVVGDNFKDI